MEPEPIEVMERLERATQKQEDLYGEYGTHFDDDEHLSSGAAIAPRKRKGFATSRKAERAAARKQRASAKKRKKKERHTAEATGRPSNRANANTAVSRKRHRLTRDDGREQQQPEGAAEGQGATPDAEVDLDSDLDLDIDRGLDPESHRSEAGERAGAAGTAQQADVPPERLFRGFTFVLTGLRGQSISQVMGVETDPKDAKKDAGTLIERAIRRGGGKVLGNVQAMARSGSWPPHPLHAGYPSLILLAGGSGRPLRTVKYLLAVAVGHPPVHARWVLHSAGVGRLAPLLSYVLPVGYSMTRSQYLYTAGYTLPSHTAAADSDADEAEFADGPQEKTPSRTSIFNDMRVEIVGMRTFREDWSMLLRAAGARVVERLCSSFAGDINVVLFESRPLDTVVQEARKRNAALVSVEWATQSLFHRRALSPDLLEVFDPCKYSATPTPTP
jgi:BRCA1 C Terminus (BRCT) domain